MADSTLTDIELGDRVRDTLTGFTGIVTAISSFFNGCTRVQVQPTELDEKGMKRSDEVFDVQQCEIVTRAAVLPKWKQERLATKKEPKRTGGPQSGEAKLLA